MIKHIFAFFFGTVFLVFLFSCNNNDTFTMGEELVNSKTNVITIDTSTIRCYTVKRDSIVTSGTGKALIGTNSDGDLGTIAASTYFQMALPTSTAIDANAVYDSITLSLNFSHYYYGDTTKPYTVEAYKIGENLEERLNANGYLYNTSNIYSPEMVGTATILRPRPSRNDSIHIKLSDAFGQDLFGKVKSQTTEVTNATEFLKYLKGFALKPKNTSAILGFNVADTSLHLRLHYTYKSENSIVHANLNFSVSQIVSNSSYTYAQFNHIETIKNSSINSFVDGLNKLENLEPSTLTKNQTYCQAGTGIMTKLEFPYLKQLLQTGTNIKILSAELILCPIKGTYHTIPLPKSLYLNYTDNLNTLGSLLTDSKGYTITPTLTIDDQYNEKTQYSFDLTSYITSAVNQTSTSIPALEVSISSDQNYTSLNRVVLGDALRNINTAKLKILYWRY